METFGVSISWLFSTDPKLNHHSHLPYNFLQLNIFIFDKIIGVWWSQQRSSSYCCRSSFEPYRIPIRLWATGRVLVSTSCCADNLFCNTSCPLAESMARNAGICLWAICRLSTSWLYGVSNKIHNKCFWMSVCWLILIDRMGASMQLPGAAAWVPQTPTQLTPAATPNSAMPQAIAYPTMQQFQVSPQVNLFISFSYKIPSSMFLNL